MVVIAKKPLPVDVESYSKVY
jgi:hypothetical protein